jgi:hypothetical protein
VLLLVLMPGGGVKCAVGQEGTKSIRGTRPALLISRALIPWNVADRERIERVVGELTPWLEHEELHRTAA